MQRRRDRVGALWIWPMLLFAVGAGAQERAGEPAAANLPAQKMGPHDLIAVSIYGSPELSRTVRISSEGLIRLPMLRRRLEAAGRLPAEMESAIAESLIEERILVDPVVTVTVVEYHSRPISVAGAVRRPVTFQAYGTVTLLEAITRAEGLSADAGPEIVVNRMETGTEESPRLVRRIPVKELLDGRDLGVNLRLYGGEQILVPEADKIFVVGNVKRPGAFPVRDSSDTTLLKLLALAEGLTPYAGRRAYLYRRETGRTAKTEIPIELRKIVERKAADVPLQANDILYIPDSKGRRMTLSALERIAGFGMATASGVLIWGR